MKRSRLVTKFVHTLVSFSWYAIILLLIFRLNTKEYCIQQPKPENRPKRGISAAKPPPPIRLRILGMGHSKNGAESGCREVNVYPI